MNDIPWKLLEKHFAYLSDSGLETEVKTWIERAPENKMIYIQLSEYFTSKGSLPLNFEPDLSIAREKVAKILFGSKLIKPRKFFYKGIIWKAASLLIIGSLCWWLIKNPSKTKNSDVTVLFTTDSTQNSIILADGSKIWLNNHSVLKYPKKFELNREVYLQGEAYFEITHDTIHPFIVYTGKTQTKVIGTKFNIKESNTDHIVEVSLIEGKVGFGVKTDHEIILTPGQQAVYLEKTESVVKRPNNNPNFISWKTYEFHFDSQPLAVVLQNLADVYHFSYQFNSPELISRKLTASFLHRPLEEIFQTISLAAEVKISFQNGKYSIQ